MKRMWRKRPDLPNGMRPTQRAVFLRNGLGQPVRPEAVILKSRLVARASVDAKSDPAVFSFFRQIVVP